MFEQFFTYEYIIAFINSVLRMSTPLIFCAMGALIADHAGTMNMALEGIMLSSSFTAVLFSAWTNSVWGGIIGAVLGSVVIAALLAYLQGQLDTVDEVICAYNAGLGTVQGWLADENSDGLPDAITYPETKHYLERVKEALRQYTRYYPSGMSTL